MSTVPFTVYDFFAYLSSGSVLVALLDYLFGFRWLMAEKQPIGIWLLLGLASYILGHAVAHLSAMVFEDFLVGRVLGKPTTILMGGAPRFRVAKFLFRGFHRSLPPQTRDRIEAQASTRGFFGKGEGLFLHAFGQVTKDEKAQRRLDEFRNLYGFARNMAFSLAVAAILLAVGKWISGKPESYWAAVGAGIVGFVMFYRYLKFYRQYGYQLLVTYAELGPVVEPQIQKA